MGTVLRIAKELRLSQDIGGDIYNFLDETSMIANVDANDIADMNDAYQCEEHMINMNDVDIIYYYA